MRILCFVLLFASLSIAVPRPTLQDFAACFEKNKASILSYEGMNAFALSENELAVIKTPNTKLNKYVKYDPFLNLYLVRTDFSLFPTVTYDEQNLTRNDWVGIIDPNNAYIGHLKYLAENINERDRLDFATKIGQLNTPCCSMLGISLGDGSFIGNRYLKHFLKYNDVYWGDVGVDFAMRDNKIYVENVRKSGQFMVNDEIVSVDGNNYKTLRELNEKILFADRGATLYFNVLRDNVDLNISAQTFAKDVSKLLAPPPKPKPPAPPSYRSNLGLTVNASLVVTRVESGSKASSAGFLVGDKILRVNNQPLRDHKSLQNALAMGNSFDVLIARSSKNLPIANSQNSRSGDGVFQFFIRLEK